MPAVGIAKLAETGTTPTPLPKFAVIHRKFAEN
jgi:hypothetical protein